MQFSKSKQRIAATVFGVVFLSVILIIALVVKNPTPFQEWVFNVVLALAGAGVAATIPGFLNVEVSPVARAGGALAVFIVIFFFKPAAAVSDTKINLPRAAVLDLKREILVIRGEWETLEETGEPAWRRVSESARPLAEDLASVDDSQLSLGARIQQQQYVAYANVMACDVACERDAGIAFCTDAVVAAERGLALVRQATGLLGTSEDSRLLSAWMRQERIPDRLHFLLALAHALKARLGVDESREAALAHLAQVSEVHKRENGSTNNPLLVPLLCEAAGSPCPEIATGPYPCSSQA